MDIVDSVTPVVDRTYSRPRRSCLSVPGHAVRMHEKALAVPADEVVFDLEDAVAPTAKQEAREAIARTLWTLGVDGAVGRGPGQRSGVV